MISVHPYLNFEGNTEEAFNHYRSVFGGEFAGVLRFRDMGANEMGLSETDLDKIMHIALPVGSVMLMGTDVLESLGQKLNVGNNTYINLTVDSAADADRLFAGLSEGGTVEMPLDRTEWAERYGICRDRFGVQWMVNFEGDARSSLGS